MRKLSVEEIVEGLFGHRPLYVQNPEGSTALIRGWVKCSCGAAVADGVTRYEKLWSDHMKEVLMKLASTDALPITPADLVQHWCRLAETGTWGWEGTMTVKACAEALKASLKALDEVQGIGKPHINDMLNFTAEEKARLEAHREGVRSSRISMRVNVFALLNNWLRTARYNPQISPEAHRLLLKFADEVEKILPAPEKS